MHTPRFWGHASRAGTLFRVGLSWRPCRINWLIVGISCSQLFHRAGPPAMTARTRHLIEAIMASHPRPDRVKCVRQQSVNCSAAGRMDRESSRRSGLCSALEFPGLCLEDPAKPLETGLYHLAPSEKARILVTGLWTVKRNIELFRALRATGSTRRSHPNYMRSPRVPTASEGRFFKPPPTFPPARRPSR